MKKMKIKTEAKSAPKRRKKGTSVQPSTLFSKAKVDKKRGRDEVRSVFAGRKLAKGDAFKARQ